MKTFLLSSFLFFTLFYSSASAQSLGGSSAADNQPVVDLDGGWGSYLYNDGIEFGMYLLFNGLYVRFFVEAYDGYDYEEMYYSGIRNSQGGQGRIFLYDSLDDSSEYELDLAYRYLGGTLVIRGLFPTETEFERYSYW